MIKNKIFIIGGAGYVGSKLVPLLIANNFDVTVYDLFIYGDTIPDSNKINKVKGDIRDIKKLTKVLPGHQSIIHLACISNDPSFDLDPELGKSINFDPFEELVKISKNLGIENFIYASSSSVYGLKDEKNVTENASLEPLTDYSKFKAMCEDILLKHATKNFCCTILRPATVCGFSKRQRLDLVVNILTNIGYHTGNIKVFGGKQLRPNINIDDMCNAYLHVLNYKNKKDLNSEIYNVGFENQSVEDLAKLVKNNLKEKTNLEYVKTDDNRSYHISSQKISQKLGYKTKKNINDAIIELIDAFDNKLLYNPMENEMYFNIKRMKSVKLI